MKSELVFAALRQGDLDAERAWELVAPLVTTEDEALATRLCDSLRGWTWKTLDRRRRDAGLSEWVVILNRVEAFMADRFAPLATLLQTLVDLVQESIDVADVVDAASDALLARKHVPELLRQLSTCTGDWSDRIVLMRSTGLKPANMTRLMNLLVDAGWVEQTPSGREVAYRISIEGLKRSDQVRAADADNVLETGPTGHDPAASFQFFDKVIVRSFFDHELPRHLIHPQGGMDLSKGYALPEPQPRAGCIFERTWPNHTDAAEEAVAGLDRWSLVLSRPRAESLQ